MGGVEDEAFEFEFCRWFFDFGGGLGAAAEDGGAGSAEDEDDAFAAPERPCDAAVGEDALRLLDGEIPGVAVAQLGTGVAEGGGGEDDGEAPCPCRARGVFSRVGGRTVRSGFCDDGLGSGGGIIEAGGPGFRVVGEAEAEVIDGQEGGRRGGTDRGSGTGLRSSLRIRSRGILGCATRRGRAIRGTTPRRRMLWRCRRGRSFLRSPRGWPIWAGDGGIDADGFEGEAGQFFQVPSPAVPVGELGLEVGLVVASRRGQQAGDVGIPDEVTGDVRPRG